MVFHMHLLTENLYSTGMLVEGSGAQTLSLPATAWKEIVAKWGWDASSNQQAIGWKEIISSCVKEDFY